MVEDKTLDTEWADWFLCAADGAEYVGNFVVQFLSESKLMILVKSL